MRRADPRPDDFNHVESGEGIESVGQNNYGSAATAKGLVESGEGIER